jgi:hypothetical protein
LIYPHSGCRFEHPDQCLRRYCEEIDEVFSDTLMGEYKGQRLIEGVQPATINHDLRVLRRMLRLAERKRLIVRNPFVRVEFLKQCAARPPHIVTF